MAVKSQTVSVIVEQPSGSYNRYGYDAKTTSIRLSEVVGGQPPAPFEQGYIPHALGSGGQPLRAALLISQPTFPGCLVGARPIGWFDTIRGNGNSPIILCVAEADTALDHIHDAEDLDAVLRQALELEICRQLGAMSEFAEVKLQGSASAHEVIRQAQERGRREEAEGRNQSRRSLTAPAWMVPDDTVAEALTFRARGAGDLGAQTGEASTERHTRAEYSLYTAPARFQDYLADCLLPDERILYFLSRPAFTMGQGLWGRHREREGLLVVSDRRVLLLEDESDPDATLVRWGYIAHSTAVERIIGVAVNSGRDHQAIEIRIRAEHGEGQMRVNFPASYSQAGIGQVAALLRRFIPLPLDEERHLLRLYTYDPEREAKQAIFTDVHRAALPAEAEQRLESALGIWQQERGQQVHATALTPGWDKPAQPATLLAITAQELVVVRDTPGSGEILVYPLADIASLELRYSLFGCALAWQIPGAMKIANTSLIYFNSPLFPDWQRIYRIACMLQDLRMKQPGISSRVRAGRVSPKLAIHPLPMARLPNPLPYAMICLSVYVYQHGQRQRRFPPSRLQEGAKSNLWITKAAVSRSRS